jgi:hypothetical protein
VDARLCSTNGVSVIQYMMSTLTFLRSAFLVSLGSCVGSCGSCARFEHRYRSRKSCHLKTIRIYWTNLTIDVRVSCREYH